MFTPTSMEKRKLHFYLADSALGERNIPEYMYIFLICNASMHLLACILRLQSMFLPDIELKREILLYF